MDELLTNLVIGSVVLLFGGFIALLPHRYLHPFRGKAVHHPRFVMVFMRVCGSIVCLGGVRFVTSSLWALLRHTNER